MAAKARRLWGRDGGTRPDPAPPCQKTKRQCYRRGLRPLGPPVGTKAYLHERPHHELRNPAWPLDRDELRELERLLGAGDGDVCNTALYERACRAGQVTWANL